MNPPDPLSPLGRSILKSNAAHAYERLVPPAGPTAEVRNLFANVSPDQLLGVPVKSHASAATAPGALWLWHDALDESHKIFQQSPASLHSAALSAQPSLAVLPTAPATPDEGSLRRQLQQEEETLSFWHAIMHRREGDFSNAKYWYARCPNHPILHAILAQVIPIVGPMPADKTILKLTMHGWNPAAFVDIVERVDGKPTDPFHRLAVSVQQLEWRLLFDHTVRAATGTGAGVQFFTPENHGA